jgi:hypothetical protein
VHCFFTSTPWILFSFVFQVPISDHRGTNVHKSRTLEEPGLLELGESAKLNRAVGSTDLAEVVVESAKPTPLVG